MGHSLKLALNQEETMTLKEWYDYCEMTETWNRAGGLRDVKKWCLKVNEKFAHQGRAFELCVYDEKTKKVLE